MTRDKIIAIIILAIVVIIIIYVLFNVKICPTIDKPVVPFTLVKDKLKTGDVLSIHGCSLLKATVMRNYLGCKATHVGMIVRKPSSMKGLPDELYVLELGPYGKFPNRNSDVRFRSLEQVMKESCHDVFGLTPIDEELHLSDEDIKEYFKYKFNYFIPTMFSKYKEYKVCSSFVAKVHEDNGIVNEDSHEMSPCDYYNSEKTIFFRR